MLKGLKSQYIDSSLRKKIILLISFFVTLTPTTLVAITALLYYKLGIESLFNEQINQSLNQTVTFAELYLQEHKENIKSEVLAIAKDFERNYPLMMEDPTLLQTFMDKQAEVRNLSEVIIFQRDRILAKNSFSFSSIFDKISEQDLVNAEEGGVVLLGETRDKVRAILKLGDIYHSYLLVGRYVDSSILDFLETSKGAAKRYESVLTDLGYTKLTLEAIFFLVFFLICIASVMLGKKLAGVIVRPLNELVNATIKLQQGDFSIKLSEKAGKDETAILTRAFNQMTEKLSAQRNELINLNEQIDQRRRFIEKVLSEISAGVITLNPKGKTLYTNAAAVRILGIEEVEKLDLREKLPEISELLVLASNEPSKIHQANIKTLIDGKFKHLYLQVSAQTNSNGKIENFVITFDDISELVAVQRMSAWGDVARRIAHEIKNPLTPITLAAERIQRKFGASITDNKETFDRYLDTITRHVGEIGRIVEEFVNFARIPVPHKRSIDIKSLVKDIVFAQSELYPNTSVKMSYKIKKKVIVHADAMQISQVMTNIIKNAAESIAQKQQAKDKKFKGVITIELTEKDSKQVLIKVIDNGLGIPSEMMEKIFEPYITSKSSGTGLGLSIVNKILEDHNSQMRFETSSDGAIFYFTLPIVQGEKDNV